jgi:hypothetical protein
MPTLVSYNMFVSAGLRVWVSLNDLPLSHVCVVGSYTVNGGINERLVPGENTITIQVEHTASRNDGPEHHGLGTRELRFVLFKAGATDDEVSVLAEWRLPELFDRVPEERRSLPFHWHERFRLDEDLYRSDVFEKPPSEVPCEGTEALRSVVREIYDVTASGDGQLVRELYRYRAREYDRAFAGHMSRSLLGQLDGSDVDTSELVLEPLREGELHYRPRAGGRVVEVTRVGGDPVFRVHRKGDPDEGAATDHLLLVEHEGRWRLY